MNHNVALSVLKERLSTGRNIIKMYQEHPNPVYHVMNLFYPNIEDEVMQLEETISLLENGDFSTSSTQNFVVIEQHVEHKEHVRILYSGSNEEKAKIVFTEKVHQDENESWKVWVEQWEDGVFKGTIEVY
jgi:hypothetical protein